MWTNAVSLKCNLSKWIHMWQLVLLFRIHSFCFWAVFYDPRGWILQTVPSGLPGEMEWWQLSQWEAPEEALGGGGDRDKGARLDQMHVSRCKVAKLPLGSDTCTLIALTSLHIISLQPWPFITNLSPSTSHLYMTLGTPHSWQSPSLSSFHLYHWWWIQLLLPASID